MLDPKSSVVDPLAVVVVPPAVDRVPWRRESPKLGMSSRLLLTPWVGHRHSWTIKRRFHLVVRRADIC